MVGNTCLASFLDTISWRWSSSGRFSARSAYNFLIFDRVDDHRILQLWQIKIHLRIKIFLWLAARNRILTADLLAKKGWHRPSICLLCCGNVEDLEHLFFRCPYARIVWSRILHGEQRVLLDLLNPPGELATRWRRARSSLTGRAKDFVDLCIAATCWELWMERNQRLFNNRLTRGVDCGNRIISTINLWMLALGG